MAVSISSRTTLATTVGVSLPRRSSWRCCSTYCISSFSCGVSIPSWIVSFAGVSLDSNLVTNPSISVRPLAFQVLVWEWHSGDSACGHNEQCRIRQVAPGRGCFTGSGSRNHEARCGRPARSHRCACS